MNIKSLIAMLEHYKLQHGDIRCVTPRFHECDIDDINSISVINIIPNAGTEGMTTGAHLRSEQETDQTEKAVMIDI